MAFTFGAKLNPKIKVLTPQFRSVPQASPPLPKPIPSHPHTTAQTANTPAKTAQTRTVRCNGNGRAPTPTNNAKLAPPSKKRKASRQASPANNAVNFRSDSDESPSSSEVISHSEKRFRPSPDRKQDDGRRAFSSMFREGTLKIIHAADVRMKGKGKSATSELLRAKIIVEVQYPGAAQRERYALAFAKDHINPAEDIYAVAQIVGHTYLRGEQQEKFIASEPQPGPLRKLERAKNHLCQNKLSEVNPDLLEAFKAALDNYNIALAALIKGGAIDRNFASNRLSPDVASFIVKQVYHRVVSPQVDIIHSKVEDKNNTYGELESFFVSRIISETKLKSDQVFIDLGSGVGNVVLQVALEVGCESWGCEMREVSCKAADQQKEEFKARCRLWGLKAGGVHLQKGDFRENDEIRQAMKKADVILVNNEVFGADLNQYLKDVFLDCKDGCCVVSLKSFGPSSDKRNDNDTFSQFVIKELDYYSGDVSWKGEGGKYYVATKDPEAALKAQKTYEHYEKSRRR
ncbi:histone methylation protein DOT1-domain-containing protein [Calycina marina]|uniref:Histone-lysine N-methyltransferase, H3 lysine-79 specific n=1 Tax=Calycina marina TaxID=1763456 RepID=A0A9P7Z0T3_9HELO|nr:histone methylation protein DOT1-domain-containing protein [Calycina marina]